MVENPALVSQVPPRRGLALAAMILGIISIFIPVLGIPLALTAIIFAIVLFIKKTPFKGYATVALITSLFALVISAFAIFLVTWFSGHSLLFPGDSTRNQAVKAMTDSKKDFAIGETAVVGSVDVKILTVERNHVLTEDEKLPASRNPDEQKPESAQNDFYADNGNKIAEEDAEYVVVTGRTTKNLNYALEDGRFDLDRWRVNGVRVYTQLPVSASQISTQDGPTFAYIYRIRKDADKLVLKGNVTIFTAVSPIVGTEGAPRKTFTYTIALN